ncbi:MAG: DNA-3-methyladenine glycosylase 2 family protein [Bdellovibrionales bacterium]|nr:DNA-3-methyladenine glycosylase 2 family protein [Bdellovibrionales bacterium]
MNHEIFYEAMLARDYRFDGKFYTGVKTTGIYCRPICPAKPKRENVEFFLSATAAEKSGYRPCLRCRPECAPLSPAWYGRSAIVQRALKVIAADGFFDTNEDKFADQFGVTARHLRRLFIEEVGLTPKKIAFNNRLNFARKLIVESDLPMTSVAMTAGFSSLRRFNDSFKKRFHRAPSEMRKKRHQVNTEGVLLSLSYRPPLDWTTLLNHYHTHQIIGVESVTEDTYERIFRIGKTVGLLRVKNSEDESQLKLHVSVGDPTVLFSVSQKVRQMFDLDSDPILVANSFQSQKFLDSLWKKYPGLRLARGWDAFETAICTILGQLVSVQQAKTLVAQLVEHYGEKVKHRQTGKTGFLFPTPATLSKANLFEVKTTKSRKTAIREFSRLVSTRNIDLLTPQDDDFMKTQLLSIPGIGPWSAEYISLRAFGSTDAFPHTDLILKRAIEKHPEIDFIKLRPWRSYAAIYLWKHYAAELSGKKGKKK